MRLPRKRLEAHALGLQHMVTGATGDVKILKWTVNLLHELPL